VINHGVEFKSVIEPVAELGKVSREMPAADCVIRAPQGILHVADDRVEPYEPLARVILGIMAHDDRLMLAFGIGNAGKTVQAVGHDKAPRADVFGAPGCYFFPGKAIDLAHLEKQGMTFGR
jgi:hypothetical protein